MIATELSQRAAFLAAARTPFAIATVVRAQRPTSVRPGAGALVLPDGTIEGFVGGTCSEQSVRLHGLRVLETGEPLLLRIVPDEGAVLADEGAVVEHNPCLSGGALEIFLEPVLPAPRLLVVGATPVATALARLAPVVGLDVRETTGAGPEPDGAELALVVASHGRDELETLRAGLEADLPYVGLVASRKRGAGIVGELRAAGVREDRLARLETPAGMSIGARTPEEIALSILVRIVAVRRERGVLPPVLAPEPAVDPVCGMTVAVSSETPRAEHEGRVVHFCCDGCRARFEEDPARFAAAH